ncbi:cerebellin 20 [Gadus chalcogrammus]|uniref:complement C1q tumor necrosis factor-related protein 6-like n=1 Tax=Gadus chalcogrammus TaxID=1042646 RepID=UPI0024C4B3CA|nr:complement C1q tumor necrosis factor-related protein 6-like [Gadus chalcogrammus]XP_056468386.1 cerebellin 20 [Gadus chalcogrammus]
MKAIAFLALLVCYASSVQSNIGNYSWEGPDSGSRVQPPSPEENECLPDTASCGCCLMKQTMHRMEEFFNMSLGELQHSLTETRSVLNNMRASRSAFSVALTDRRWCLGPFLSDQVIIYRHVFLNLGGNYNIFNGIFVAPRSGVYLLSLTVYSDSGSAGSHLAACATMMVNDQPAAILRDLNSQDQEDSSTSVQALMLSAGDTVKVVLPKGCFLCDSGNHYNTFTGVLLYSTD